MGTQVELYEAIRRDFRLEELSIRALAGRHGVHRRTVRAALASAIPAPRKVPVRVAPKLQAAKEGVVSKRLTSTYRPGARSPEWVKTKNVRIQEVVVGGWSTGQGRRSGAMGSLLLGLPDPPGTSALDRGGGLRYIGHVGTGFTAALLADLGRRLTALQQAISPFTAAGGVPREHARGAHWVTPTIVAEVAYAEWTPDGVLRHPSWRGYRPDKQPSDVIAE